MTDSRETGLTLDPKWGPDGLITAVVTDADSGAVLMVAHMNADALGETVESGEAVFWSRSRGERLAQGRDVGGTRCACARCGSIATRTRCG